MMGLKAGTHDPAGWDKALIEDDDCLRWPEPCALLDVSEIGEVIEVTAEEMDSNWNDPVMLQESR